MNLLFELTALLKKRTTLYANVFMDVWPATVEAIIYRYDPSRAKVVSYIDGSSTTEQNVSYYCRSKTAETARLQCDTIGTALDLCQFEISQGRFISCLENTETAFVGTTDTGAFIYVKTLKIEYQRS